MNFDHLITNQIGLIHFIFSIIALICGSLVLMLQKGTNTHKRIGYVYAISMSFVLITAFSMYNLFGTWGIFHWMALVSTLTLAGGLMPIFFKVPKNDYISLHFSFMYWSVIGLYGAFVSETFVRIPDIVVESGVPNAMFFKMSGIATAITMGIGIYFFIRNRSRWSEAFEK